LVYKSFKQFVAEALEKKTWRGPDMLKPPKKRFNRLQNIDFKDANHVSGIPVKVHFNKNREDARRAYGVDFSVNDHFHAPDRDDDPSRWRKHEKVLSHLPSIMRHVKKTIEKFASEKKPNELHLQANDESKVKLYRSFAQHLAKKHGGRVEERPMNPYDDNPKIVVHLPGKKK
jgi:hypothetical protein